MPKINLEAYRVRVVQLLVNQIPHRALAQIVDSSQGLRGHLAEFEVQRMMTNLLSMHLPSPELVDWNVALKHPSLKATFIPDIQIKDVHLGLWAAYEVKTLFPGAALDLDVALADLAKLTEYKKSCPDLGCYFWLVADSQMLNDARRLRSWRASPLNYDIENFAQRQVPRIIDDTAGEKYVVRPAMASARGQVSCYAWEVQPFGKGNRDMHSDFHFSAVMSNPANSGQQEH